VREAFERGEREARLGHGEAAHLRLQSAVPADRSWLQPIGSRPRDQRDEVERFVQVEPS
jgi:hypothetical protein